jgi:hypothetical protein
MKSIFLLFSVALLVGCTSSSTQEAYHGQLEDFVVGEMSFERGAESGHLSFQEQIVYRGKEVIYTKWNGILHFYDPASGRKISTFEIPKEGPTSIKGTAEVAKVFENDMVMATNATGITQYLS